MLSSLPLMKEVAAFLGMEMDETWVYGKFADLLYLVNVMRNDYGHISLSSREIYLSDRGNGTYQVSHTRARG